MHDGILSHRKESDPDTWDKMDATGDHYARRNKCDACGQPNV